MSELVKELKRKLEAMSDEEYLALWDSVKEYENVGPSVDEYLKEVLIPTRERLEAMQSCYSLDDMQLNYSFDRNKVEFLYTKDCDCNKAA